MNGPAAFSVFTLVHAAIGLLALACGVSLLGVGTVQYLPAAAFCLFIVEAVTAFDNGVTVAGNRLGIGPRTERLNRVRFFLHATCIGLLVPVYTGIANTLAFSGSLATALNLTGWLLAVAIILFGYYAQYRRTGALMPVSYFGCLRYATSVSDFTRHPEYEYSAQQLAARGSLPLASVLTTLIGLLIAALTGWFGSFWLPFVVTALMLSAGGFAQRSWGPFATSCLEIIYSGGMLYSLLYAAGQLGQ
jgi:hypothetical protein